MKKIIPVIMLLINAFFAQAQQPDRQFFDAPSETRSLSLVEANNMFGTKTGGSVSVEASDGSLLKFQVNMNDKTAEGVEVIAGHLKGTLNAYFILHRLRQGNTFLYEGKLFSNNIPWAFKITNTGNQLVFQKMKRDEIVVQD